LKKKEHEEQENRKESTEDQIDTKEEEKMQKHKYITIWDLPADINRKEIEYMCRRFKKAHITRIKRSKYKSLAIIQIEETKEDNIPWSIPVNNNKLVRVTEGEENYEERQRQSQYTAKITDLPSKASEVLLLRCLRSKGAKSVYIPPNRNGNQRRTAIITFATEEEMKAAQSKPIRYNNFQVSWLNERRKEIRKEERGRGGRNRSWERASQNLNKRYTEKRRDLQRQDTEEQLGGRDITDKKSWDKNKQVPVERYIEIESDP
jgi:hypothetical protein